MTYSKVLHQKYNPKLEQLGQEFEIILSGDFENMSLDELNKALAKFNDFVENLEIGERGDLYTHDGLEQARDFLWYRIREEENKNDSVKVGDIFHTSWGYDQTNTEYFKVISISKTGKTCEVVQIGSETVKGSEGYMCESITPTPEIVLHGGMTCKVKIERSKSWHPYKKRYLPIGEIMLRGSVFFTNSNDKHLQNLYRVDPTKQEYRSWYA